jgi:hypothetical protein
MHVLPWGLAENLATLTARMPNGRPQNTRSGLKARLEVAGYSVTRAWDSKLAELELKGWEIVVESDAEAVLTKFRFDEVGPHQTLVKKKN